MSGVKLISQSLIDSVAQRAETSPRLRMNYNFHADAADNPHRFLNVLLAGTYIRPHRHANPPKAESFLLIEGAAEVITFDDDGLLAARYRLGEHSSEGHLWGVDIAAGVWHTIVPLTSRAVCFEVKPGPWFPETDKEFAPWAPAEGDDSGAIQRYVRTLLCATM